MRRIHIAGLIGLVGSLGVSAFAHAELAAPQVLASGLDGPRAVADGPRGRVAFSLADGTVRHVVRTGPGAGTVTVVLRTQRQAVAPAVDINRKGTIFALTSAPPPGGSVRGAGVLYRWVAKQGKHRIANITRYQKGDPDPYNLEGSRRESNPFGVAALPRGGALVADAAGNDVLRVSRRGNVVTVARVKPRRVRVPSGLGPDAPPAGTRMWSEAVVTSVTVGPDGYWYVGELRGYPATPGKSQIWRIKPGTRGAVCNPRRPNHGPCKRYADGFTSIVELDRGDGGLYVVELSKQGWLKLEMGAPGSSTGSLFWLGSPSQRVEVMPGELAMPGGVAARDGHLYVGTGMLTDNGQIIRVR